jgi:hypothetical protein
MSKVFCIFQEKPNAGGVESGLEMSRKTHNVSIWEAEEVDAKQTASDDAAY